MSAARRRAKARARAGYAFELGERHATVRTDCSCGWSAWLAPGHSVEDLEWLQAQAGDHQYMHSLEESSW